MVPKGPEAGDDDTSGDRLVWTIVVAAGSGARFGGRKHQSLLDGRRVVDVAVDQARQAGHRVVRVVADDELDDERARATAGEIVVAGGLTRSASVRAGLAAVDPGAAVVCVHDAARPLATPALFAAVVAAVGAGADAAIPGVAVTDTIKQVDDPTASPMVVVATPPRDRLVAVQTPQAFAAAVLRRAHAEAGEATDDAALVEAAGGRVVVVPGEPDNRKITVAADLEWAAARLAARRGSS